MLAVVCLCATAQETGTAAKPKKAQEPVEIRDVDVTKMLAAQLAPSASAPDRVVAVVDGMKITAGELFQFYQTLPSNMQFYYGQNRKEFVERYAVVLKLAREALTRKLDQQEPYKHQLDFARKNILMQATMDDLNEKNVVRDEDQQKYYKDHLDEFTQAKVSGIFIGGFSDNAQRAADIIAKLKAGADFATLAKEHSTDKVSADRDGLIGNLDKTGNYPPQVMKTIMALKPGEISEPVALDNGFWIFRLEEIQVMNYSVMKDKIHETMKTKVLTDWLEKARKGLKMDVLDESYFKVEMPKTLQPVELPAAK